MSRRGFRGHPRNYTLVVRGCDAHRLRLMYYGLVTVSWWPDVRIVELSL